MKKLLLIFVLFPFLSFGQEILIEEIHLKNGDISLPGTLSYPKSNKKSPLLIFVHGSGNIDRNGNQGALAKANYIAQLADSLNKKGISFYRYDKRTSNATNYPFLKDIKIEDFVEDVSIAIKNFKNDKRFKSIHLIGHSQGSLIAMLATNKNIKSYISLAGPSNSIDSVIVNQINKQNHELSKITKQHFKELKETDTIQKVNPLLLQLFAPQNQKFFKSWMSFIPKEELKKIEKPILIIQGKKDNQVTVTDANQLFKASTTGNTSFKPAAQLTIIDSMNHVLKTVSNATENQQSYTSPDFPLSIDLVNNITTFILKNE